MNGRNPHRANGAGFFHYLLNSNSESESRQDDDHDQENKENQHRSNRFVSSAIVSSNFTQGSSLLYFRNTISYACYMKELRR
ncbi:hypothetical protein SAMN04488688_10825 [Paenibacillus sp. cl141a]|nr:hypothetical protein SAMN04488688_10825 [Paenibacillus sp. cl141a]